MLFLLSGLLTGFPFSHLNATTITSAQNGRWNLATTWVGGVIPKSADDVVVSHTIDITSGDSCFNLTVSPGGIVRNVTGNSRTLVVMGSLVNNGAMQITTYNLYVRVAGNVTNNGTWTSVSLRFIGSAAQYISQAEGKDFNGNGKLIEDYDSLSPLILASNVVWRNFEVDMDMGYIEIPAGLTLSLYDGYFTYTCITGNMSALVLRNTAYIQYSDLTDLHLKGTILVGNGVKTYGEIIVDDTLLNYGGANRWLTCYSNFRNDGFINKGVNYNINFNFFGDVINNGIWTCSQIEMAGTTTQNIHCTGTKFITCADFIDQEPSSPINLTGDLYFKDTQLDLNSGTMYCNGHYLTMRGAPTAGSATFNQVRLKGLFRPYNSELIFTDWVEVCDTLQEPISNYYTVTINGNLINNGVIRKSTGYGVRLYLNGNLENNGFFSPNSITFSGTTDQYVSSSVKSNLIQLTNMTDNHPASSIILLSDLTLSSTEVDLGGATILLQNGNLIQSGSFIKNGILTGSSSMYLKQTGGAFLEAVTIHNLHLKGTVRVYVTDVVLNNVTLDDTLTDRNTSSYKYVTLRGSFINNGKIIESNTFGIRFYVEDTIINNGIWKCELIDFKGTGMHYIETAGGNVFEIELINATGGGNILAGNELRFMNSEVNLSGRSLNIPASCPLYATNSVFRFMTLAGNNSTGWFENTYFVSIVVQNMILTGSVELESNVNFEINNNISGILQNRGISNHYIFNSYGEFYNHGTIRNRPSFTYKLDYYSFGNVYNDGTWKIRKNYWKGLIDQDIYLMNNKNIGTESQFDAMITATSYQWYKNDTLMAGKTQSSLIFDSLMVSHRAFYQCKTNEGNSRIIRVCTPVGITLSEQLFICYGDSVQLQPVVTSGSAPYVYEWSPSLGLSAANILNPWARPFTTTTYKLKVTDRIGCIGEVYVTVEVNPFIAMSAGEDLDLCMGSGITMGASVSGGTPGYSYSWTPAYGLSNPQILNPLASPTVTTQYTLTVTDSKGCQKSDEVLVTVNPLPQAYNMLGGGEYCTGDPGIIIGLSGSQFTVKYHLLRNGSPTGIIVPGSSGIIEFGQFTIAGTYTVRAVYDFTFCEQMMNGSAVIVLKDSPEFTQQPQSQVKFLGEDAGFTAMATGTPPLYYKWFKDGDELEGEQSNTLEITDVTLEDAGSYICQVNNDCGIVPSEAAQLTVLTTQTVNIPAGWSGFSTYQQVFNPGVEDMFAPVAAQLVLVQDQSHIYWPSQAVNTYLTWSTDMGAQIKMNSAATLDIIGSPDADRLLNIPSSWYYLPVLSSCNVSSSAVFSSLGSGLKMVKDIAGSRIYWPEYGITTLNTLEPGKAYFIKMNAPGTLVFPACTKSSADYPNPVNPNIFNPWKPVIPTQNSHIIMFPDAVLAGLLQTGDILGVFTPDGLCAGISVYNGGNTAITAFGDDPTTTFRDGFSEGDLLSFRIYRLSTSETFITEYNTDQPGEFRNQFISHGITVIKDVKLTPKMNQSEDADHIRIYPNPASKTIYLEGIKSGTTFSMTNTLGEVVFTTLLTTENQLDISGFTKGVYTITLTSPGRVILKKLIIE